LVASSNRLWSLADGKIWTQINYKLRYVAQVHTLMVKVFEVTSFFLQTSTIFVEQDSKYICFSDQTD